MACCLQSVDDGDNLVDDLNQSIQEERIKITTYFQDAQENQKYNLMRGGCVIKTKVGPI